MSEPSVPARQAPQEPERLSPEDIAAGEQYAEPHDPGPAEQYAGEEIPDPWEEAPDGLDPRAEPGQPQE